MALARQAVTLAKGRPRASVQAPPRSPPTGWSRWCSRSPPTVRRAPAEGRPIVLATTTPYDLVKPFADRLGLDDVIATRYGVDADGTYDGTIVGPFVWSAGKLAAVSSGPTTRRRPGGELRLLRQRVRHAAAVGRRAPGRGQPRPADGLMAAAAPLAGAAPRRVARRGEGPGGRARAAAAGVAVLPARVLPYAASTSPAIEHIPASGPAILCGNHRSYFDVAAISVMLAKAGRTVRFLGKKEVFDAPVVGIIAGDGWHPRRPGTGSDEPLQAAADALAGRRAGGDHAPGHHPAWPGVLRSGS
jgi:putative phosphoserine phosphatase / 1-acylglycerol-3-phosphate O-acyltransferase